MTFDVAIFRQQFPEFSDTTKWPDASITMANFMAQQFIDPVDSPCRSLTGDALALALNYMTAHVLSLSLLAQQSMAGPGGVPSQGGFEASASIDKISVSKVPPPAKDAWGYWLGQTTYGQSVWALLSVKGVGGLSVGGVAEGDAFRRAYGVFGNLGNAGYNGNGVF